tara:strand:+ start:103 stop:777 length:675 start_codon:yes stop_codon:yes gene_type:complete
MNKLTKYKPNQLLAVELYSTNPSISQKEIASKCQVDIKTVRNWLSNPEFIDQIYKRYMEISGLELPAVIKAMLEEAKMGNVQAGRLVLEHYGKLENKIKVQVESPFEKFLRAEDADFVEIDDEDKGFLDEIAVQDDLDDVELPTRDPKNDNPVKRAKLEEKRVKEVTKYAIEKEKERIYQQEAYQLRKRAKKVGLELLPSGRTSKGARKKWLEELERLEKEQNA